MSNIQLGVGVWIR